MKTHLLAAAVALASVAMIPLPAAEQWTTLDGHWRFALDAKNEGVEGKWFGPALTDTIQLPGTTDEARKGTPNTAREPGRLTRVYPYVGAAWYQRDIDVPAAWAGKRIVLVLERTKITRLWVDATDLGEQNSLVAPHAYALGSLTPGRHQLTLRVANTGYPRIGDPHQISDQTQTNWNGVIGRLGLSVTDPVWIEDVQVYPDRQAHKIRVKIEVGNATGQPANGTLTMSAVPGRGSRPPAAAPVRFSVTGERGVVESEYALGSGAVEWDEFSPVLYRLSVSLQVQAGGRSLRDSKEAGFGLREFTATGAQFRVNGKPTFLRGRADNAAFPLTGYPPMTVDGWLRVFQIAKAYGLNHMRFHTWCPPEAAFQAADQAGIYLQPELPNWSAFGAAAHDDFLRAEGERLLRAYGNHPSFVMLSLGNELGGKQEAMAPFIKQFKALDPRHLYAQGTNNWFQNVPEGDDYWASFQYRGKKIRASFATVDAPQGHVQTGPPSTMKDYSAEIGGAPVPVVSHEIGEYQVAPDFREIAKVHRPGPGPQSGAHAGTHGEERHARAGGRFPASLRRAGRPVLPGRHRGGAAHARLGRLPVARSDGFSRPGDRAGGHPECVHGVQGAHRTGTLARVLLGDGAACAHAQVHLHQRRDLRRHRRGGPLRSGGNGGDARLDVARRGGPGARFR